MKKYLLSILVLSYSVSCPYANNEEKQSSSPPPKAVIASTSTATTAAWASLSISFIVVLGVIIAIAIHKSND